MEVKFVQIAAIFIAIVLTYVWVGLLVGSIKLNQECKKSCAPFAIMINDGKCFCCSENGVWKEKDLNEKK